MPILRIGSDLHYFAHVPKCAGSSVKRYLSDRFGAMALTDMDFSAQPEARRWSRTSPDHIDWASLTRMVPPSWFASVFSITRHPVARVVSAYHFQQEVEKSVPAGVAFDDWLAGGLSLMASEPFVYDNHLRPQVDFIPSDAVTFPVEGGLAPLIAHLDVLAGNSDGPRAVEGRNVRAAREATVKAVPSKASLDLIARAYAEDFARFGYHIDRPLPDGVAEEVEAPIQTRSLAERVARRLKGLVS